MKKLTNQILIVSSGFLILAIVISYFYYNHIQSQNVVCGTEMPEAFCGTATTDRSENATSGKKIFNTNCAACHTLDRIMTGPPLRNVLNRLDHPNKNFVYDFITKEDSLLRVKDTYTIGINQEYNMKFNHNFNLDKTEFENLMEYFKN